MIESAEPERRVLSDVQREMPVPVAKFGKSSFSRQHDASGASGRSSDGEPGQGSNEFRHQPGVSDEVPTARDARPVIPGRAETAGMSSASEDSLRRKAQHLIREGLESDLDGPPPHRGRKPVPDEVRSASGSEASRWRLTASVR